MPIAHNQGFNIMMTSARPNYCLHGVRSWPANAQQNKILLVIVFTKFFSSHTISLKGMQRHPSSDLHNEPILSSHLQMFTTKGYRPITTVQVFPTSSSSFISISNIFKPDNVLPLRSLSSMMKIREYLQDEINIFPGSSFCRKIHPAYQPLHHRLIVPRYYPPFHNCDGFNQNVSLEIH